MKIEPLAWRNLAHFLRVRYKLEPTTTPYFLLRMVANGKNMHTILARESGKVVGYATLIFARFRRFKGNVHLSTMIVEASHRNRGIGAMLLKKAEEEAKKRGARRIGLEVFAKNEKAIRFYKRLGYEEEGRRRDVVETKDGFDDIILMAKFLE